MIPLPDPDLAADMYEWASEKLTSAGFQQYEISNWSRPGLECRHNLQYWRGLPYLGVGAGAHGYANGYRYSNVLRIKSYIDRLTAPGNPGTEFPLTPAVVNHHRQSRQDDMSEMMMTGLRLTREGISPVKFREAFDCDLKETYSVEINELIKNGLLEWVHPEKEYIFASDSESELSRAPIVLRLTTRGRLLGNQVFMRFV
jgi:oxygen-independent coproporphyrinogen-3 oxidase